MSNPSYRPGRPIPPRRRGFRGWLNRTSNVIIGLIVALIVLVILAVPFAISRLTEKTKTFTVTRILDQTYSSGSGHHLTVKHRYLVYTDHGTYKDTDTVWFFKFNSSDLLGQLQNGHRYTCDTTGFRFGFTSSYRNLISCHPA